MKVTGKHIIFDCDGTLISSQMAIYQTIRELFRKYYEKDFTHEQIVDGYNPDLEIFGKNFGIDIHDSAQAQKLKNAWDMTLRENSFQYGVFAGVEQLIEELQSLGHNCYVWTGRDRRSTLAILKELGIISLFLDFRCMDDTIPKPHPQGLEELAGDFPKEDIIVIGDSFTDIQGAHQFGVEAIAATWCEHADIESLEAFSPDYFAKKPMDCLEIIKNKFSK